MALALGSSASSLRVGSGTPSRMYRGSTAFWDADAAAYIRAVEAADGQALELGVCNAYHNFFLELKATSGLFEAIKASCILCGARTITGALVPLAGAAPSAEGGWAAGDYSRTAGMTGDATSLYIDTNRSNDDDPQNDNHNAVFVTSLSGTDPAIASRSSASANFNYIDFFGGTRLASRTAASTFAVTAVENTLQGHSRDNGTAFRYRCSGQQGSITAASTTPDANNVLVFGRNTDPLSLSAHTIAFYSIGTDIGAAGMEALETAVSNLITAIGNAL